MSECDLGTQGAEKACQQLLALYQSHSAVVHFKQYSNRKEKCQYSVQFKTYTRLYFALMVTAP